MKVRFTFATLYCAWCKEKTQHKLVGNKWVCMKCH